MKRLIAAAALLVIITIICITGNITVSRVCRDVSELAKEGEQACTEQDWGKALTQSQRLSAYWESRKRLMSFFVNHGDIEEISLRTKALTALAQEQDPSAFREKTQEILHLLETVSGEQRFSVDAFI